MVKSQRHRLPLVAVAVVSVGLAAAPVRALVPVASAASDAAPCASASASGWVQVASWSALQTAAAAGAAAIHLAPASPGTYAAPAGERLTIGGSVTLDLCGQTISITGPTVARAAVRVPASSSLRIQDSSTDVLAAQGALVASGGASDGDDSGAGAGIGGDGGIGPTSAIVAGETSGAVTIAGGRITATGGASVTIGAGAGAGIGGGSGGDLASGGDSGPVTIAGGAVVATGGSASAQASAGSGAGIGGGGASNLAPGGASGAVVVTSGSVTATGGSVASGGSGAGAAIGGGGNSVYTRGGNAGSVTIRGGVIAAIGGSNPFPAAAPSPGLGAGYGGVASPVTVDGASVILSGNVQARLVVTAAASMTVPVGATLAIEDTSGSSSNAGTITVIGRLAGNGTLANPGSILGSGTSWGVGSAVGPNPDALSRLVITGNAVIKPRANLSLVITPASVATVGQTAALSLGGGSTGAITYATSTPDVCSIAGAAVSYLALGICRITASQAADRAFSEGSTSTSITVVSAVSAPCAAVPATGWVAASDWASLRGAAAAGVQFVYLDGPISTPYVAPDGQNLTQGRSLVLDLCGRSVTITQPTSTSAAINVGDGQRLTIQDTSSTDPARQGSIVATGGRFPGFALNGAGAGAGIGGNGSQNAGTIVVAGGSVTARGGAANTFPTGGGAGVGGGGGGVARAAGSLGSLTVLGGSLRATGGDSTSQAAAAGAGIGGGGGSFNYSAGSAGPVSVSDGSVSATGGSSSTGLGGAGAGIGGGGGGGQGAAGSGAALSVLGGSVDATGGTVATGQPTTAGSGFGAGGRWTGAGGGTPSPAGSPGAIAVDAPRASLAGQVAGVLTTTARTSLSIPAGAKLGLDEGSGNSLNAGAIVVAGQLAGSGRLTNRGTITGSGSRWGVSSSFGPNPDTTSTLVITGTPPAPAPNTNTITVTADGPLVVGTTATLASTGDSRGADSFTSLTQDVCTVAVTTVRLVAAGTCIVRNDQGADAANFVAAGVITTSFTVGRRPLTVTPDAVSIVYGSPLPTTYSYTVTGGTLLPGDTLTGECGVAETPRTVGSYPITCATLSAGDRYDVTVAPAALTLTPKEAFVVAVDTTITSGAADPTFAYRVSGLEPGDSLATEPTCTVQAAHTAPGTYPITCTGASDPRYSLSYVAGTLTVAPAPSGGSSGGGAEGPVGGPTAGTASPVLTNSAPPTISGKARVGKKVRARVGVWSPTPATYTYQWRVNGKALRGATRATLKITKALRGKRLTVTVTAGLDGAAPVRSTSSPVRVR